MCIGSAVYMLKAQSPSVSLRFALFAKMIELEELKNFNDIILDPVVE